LSLLAFVLDMCDLVRHKKFVSTAAVILPWSFFHFDSGYFVHGPSCAEAVAILTAEAQIEQGGLRVGYRECSLRLFVDRDG
jgi:hypothetical protein